MVFFKEAFQRSGKKIAEIPPNTEAVLQDMRTDLDTPFIIEHDQERNTRFGAQDIMRKKNFLVTNQK